MVHHVVEEGWDYNFVAHHWKELVLNFSLHVSNLEYTVPTWKYAALNIAQYTQCKNIPRWWENVLWPVMTSCVIVDG